MEKQKSSDIQQESELTQTHIQNANLSPKESLELEKLTQEISKIKNEKKWFRTWGIPVLQTIPGFVLAVLTFIIAENNNLFVIKDNTYKAEHIKLENEKSAIQLERNLLDLTHEKMRLDSFNQILKSDSIGLKRVNDSLSSLTKLQRVELTLLTAQAETLSRSNRFLLYDNYLKQLKWNPYANTKYAYHLAQKIKEKDEVAYRIVDSLVKMTENAALYSICNLVLYNGLNKKEYFTNILNEIENLFKENKKSFYDTTYNEIDTRFYSLFSILDLPAWTKEDEYIISEKIISLMKEPAKWVLNQNNLQLLATPAIYNNRNSMQLETRNLKMLCDYLVTNLSALNTSYRPQEIYSDEIRTKDSEDDFTTYIRSKADIVRNIASFCPQYYVAYVTKFVVLGYRRNYMDLITLNPKRRDDISVAGILFQEHRNFKIYSVFQSLIPKDKVESLTKVNTENFSEKEYIESMKSVGEIYIMIYDQNKDKIEDWLGEDHYFFRENPLLLKYKILNSEM